MYRVERFYNVETKLFAICCYKSKITILSPKVTSKKIILKYTEKGKQESRWYTRKKLNTKGNNRGNGKTYETYRKQIAELILLSITLNINGLNCSIIRKGLAV